MERTPYRTVVRLLAIADYHWEYIEADYYQIDLTEIRLSKFLNLVNVWLVRHTKEEEQEMLEFRLNEPFDWEKQSKKVIASTGDDEIALMRAAMGM